MGRVPQIIEEGAPQLYHGCLCLKWVLLSEELNSRKKGEGSPDHLRRYLHATVSGVYGGFWGGGKGGGCVGGWGGVGGVGFGWFEMISVSR